MRLVSAKEIRKHAHDVILGNGARHRCFDITMLDEIPETDAIPVEYIEYEKDRINRFIQIAVKHGDMKEADRLTGIVAVLDAIISNWRYTSGPDWRAERKAE